MLPHSSANSSTSADTNASSGSSGWIEGSGKRSSSFSRIGVESCIPSSSGVATTGISGSLAYFCISAWVAGLRTIHSCGISLYRK